MPTATLRFAWDSWMADINGTKHSNGRSARLQSGKSTVGTDVWLSRIVATTYALNSGDNLGTMLPNSGANITSATWKGRVRGTHSCFDMGNLPKFYIERLTDPDFQTEENGVTGECSQSTNTSGTRFDPGSTTVNRASYAPASAPAIGAVISKDITELFKDWYNDGARDQQRFSIFIHPHDDTAQSQRIALYSWDAGDPDGDDCMTVEVVWTTNATPSAPSVSLTPVSGSRVTGEDTRTFSGDFTDADSSAPSKVHVVVATSSAVDGSGKLTTGIVHDLDSGTFSYVSSTKRWTTTRSFAENRGTRYYYVVAVTDNASTPAKSAYSTVRYYDVNTLPVVSYHHP